jgi:hypothetical protein
VLDQPTAQKRKSGLKFLLLVCAFFGLLTAIVVINGQWRDLFAPILVFGAVVCALRYRRLLDEGDREFARMRQSEIERRRARDDGPRGRRSATS